MLVKRTVDAKELRTLGFSERDIQKALELQNRGVLDIEPGENLVERIAQQCESVLDGVLTHYCEGPGASFWGFQDKRFIRSKDDWSLDGLHVIHGGDYLTVYYPNSKRIVWSGIIELEMKNSTDIGCQKGLKRKRWARWFLKEYPARWIKKKPNPA